MLYFSKIKIFIIYFTIIILSFFSLSNFIDNDKNILFSRNVNLGLDLQGGSYLLLEVDSKPIVNQFLQQKLIKLRKYFKKNKIKYKNLKLVNNSINFYLDDEYIKQFEEYFLDKNDNIINAYYSQYRSYEMNFYNENNNIKLE